MILFRSVLLSSAVAITFAAEPVQKLPAIRVSESDESFSDAPTSQTIERVTARELADRINAVDVEDAIKYLPSIFVRKRNHGDTQAVIASRVWGVNSSARSLVYADGVLLSALLANNNSIGGPRWGLVSTAEIDRIAIRYGPFSAADPGNSMGAVVEMTTRQPERFEASLEHTTAWQGFHDYGTHETYRTDQTSATIGNRTGKFSLWVSGNYQDSHTQPLNYVTSTSLPAGITGAFSERNKFGQSAPIVGASGLLHSRAITGKLKIAYDLTSSLRATYSFGLWHNDADAAAQTYLHTHTGEPTLAQVTGFASGTFHQTQQHASHSLTLKSDTRSAFDLEAIATRFRMERDHQRLPNGADFSTYTPAGRVVVFDGTGWTTLDLKAMWRSGVSREKSPLHVLMCGLHFDDYTLRNPTFNTPDWTSENRTTTVASEGDGNTRTRALWAQDVWRVASDVTITAGARYEQWHAFDGFNANGPVAIRHPDVRARKWSPKFSAAWKVSAQWALTASVGQAYRFATSGELYQLISTGATFTSPNPNLGPDDVLATEFKLERTLPHSRMRASLFQDEIHDAIIAQFRPLIPGSSQVFSFASNVDHVRARGVEFAFEQNQFLLRGLSLNGSATYVDARTLATSGQGQFGSAIGKRLPNIPDWRATLAATWRPTQKWAFTLAGRYSGMMTTTLDAADTNPNTWQGFAAWFVADARIIYHPGRNWTTSIGTDNVLNRRYFLFHPFPQRTVVAQLKFDL